MAQLKNLSSSPHVRTSHSTSHEMFNVVCALMPATFFGIYWFGFHSLLVVLVSIASAMLTEFAFDYVTHRPNTLWDCSAVVTGLILALMLPPTVPLYIPYLGSLFAILIVKCFFGGLGQNFVNPALAGRIFLLISFGTAMTNYTIDGVSSATPLAAIKAGENVSELKMFMGFASGHIGVSIAALLLGGLYLLVTGTITPEIPVSMLLSFIVFCGILGGHGFDPEFLLSQFVGGGVVLGAFFMANDPVTSPVTSKGHIVYGIFVGFLCAVFRFFSNMNDGTSYAIVVGNLVVPLIDRYIIGTPFGIGRKKGGK